MSISQPALWDFAGFDGLALARAMFGPSVSELAAYQSLDTDWAGMHCVVLRLCENNFRVGLYGGVLADAAALLREKAAGRRVWVKPTDLVSLFLRADAEWERLAEITTTKAPHRLAGLPNHRAVPAQIAGRAALVWRHGIQGATVVEIQIAHSDCEAIHQSLWERSEGVFSFSQ